MAYGTIKVDNVTTSSGTVVLDSLAPKANPVFTGDVTINAQGDLRLSDSDSSNYVALQAGGTIGTNYTIEFPTTVGATGKVLKSTVSGQVATLTWETDTTNVAAADLTGTTMATNVVTSSLTTVGTIATGTWSATDIAVTAGGTGSSTASGARTNLGVAIGTDVQAYDAQLADVAGLAVTDGGIIVGDGSNFVLETGSTARSSLGLAIGSDVQAYDADTAKKDTAQTWTATQSGTVTEQAYSASLSLNLNTTNNWEVAQLTGAFTLANPSAVTRGASGFIKFKQIASGSTISAGFGDQWHFPGGSSSADLTQTNNAVDVLVYTVVETSPSVIIACDLIKDIQD